jgi:hypothetical protein
MRNYIFVFVVESNSYKYKKSPGYYSFLKIFYKNLINEENIKNQLDIRLNVLLLDKTLSFKTILYYSLK